MEQQNMQQGMNMQKLIDEVKEEYPDRVVASCMKLRVVDYVDRPCCKPLASATIMIWRPDQAVQSMLTEGTAYTVYMTAPMKNQRSFHALTLSTTKNTRYNRINLQGADL